MFQKFAKTLRKLKSDSISKHAVFSSAKSDLLPQISEKQELENKSSSVTVEDFGELNKSFQNLEMEEEFGFKIEGPEPTRYGDWEVKGRCSDF